MSQHPEAHQPDPLAGVLASVVHEGRRRQRRRTRLVTGVGTLAVALVVLGSTVAIARQGGGGAATTAARPLPTVAETTTTVETTTTTTPPPPTTTTIAGRRPLPTSTLVKAQDSVLLAAIKKEALAEVTPYGIPGVGPYGARDMAVPSRAVTAPAMVNAPQNGSPRPTNAPAGTSAPAPAPASDSSSEAAATTGGPTFSGTNNQEKGVDEADSVKTDGRTLFVARGNRVEVIDVTSGSPKILRRIDLGADQPNGLLLAGNRLLVFASVFDQPQPRSQPAADLAMVQRAASKVRVRTIDVTSPAQPKVVNETLIQGRYVDSRLVAGVARLVTATNPSIDLVYPADGSQAGQAKALAENKKRIRASTLAAWLPVGTKADDTYRTQVASGLDTVSIRSIDPAAATVGKAVNVLASAQTVYASTTSLYLATTEYDTAKAVQQGVRPAKTPSTNIHKLDISNPAEAVYVGSGDVPGTIIGQYALSEQGDALRIATTTEATGGVFLPADGQTQATTPVSPSSSAVTVFRPSAGALVEVGKVTGLGRNERIYGVRFVGDRGYVVTFRQIDPLYVLDLSDPTKPAVRGELKITGYSAYLHPLGDHRLLGIGVAASDQGRREGFQISLFDVKDPANPKKVSGAVIPGGDSMATFDPHAFLFWEPLGLAVLPISVHDSSGGAPFNGVIGYGVSTDAVTERARIAHPASEDSGGYAPPITRSVIVGSKLFTISDRGVQANDAASLKRPVFAGFG